MPQSNPWMTVAVLVALTVVIAWGLWTLLRIREESRGEVAGRLGRDDLLAPLRAAYEAGQMDTDEYERIRARLGVPAGRLARARRSSDDDPPARTPDLGSITDPSSNASRPEPD
jgi:hypothetical protein